MAKKQPPPPPAPRSSSSEEEEESSSDEEPIISRPIPQTPAQNQEQDDEETDDESESDSDEEEDDDEEDEEPLSNAKKPRSISTPASPAPKPLDAGEKSNGKRNANGKSLFQRIWSLEDEIAILEAMIEFEPKYGPIKLNTAGIRDFHDFVKGSLSLEVNGSQLHEKIRRIKKKYKSVAARVKNGKAVKFGKPLDEKVYELSKKVWGMENNSEAKNEGKAAKSKKAVKADGGGGSSKREYPFLKDCLANMRGGISAELWDAINPENARYLESKFKKLKVMEIKDKIREMDLMKEALERFVEDIERMTD
ncbi:uncharacterized protein A4U43_C03F19360 [Asparagus officinalis]|uniref:Glabrous enhancer-binding protein-like DBD domain-containing protein n=1 Tax=Asparagus officinalis TaxID=4686 RepID=A0A5P1FBE8_ASPOF|nr:probable transcription factor At4g00390 [Asparagus officinalis]ONK75675.1 uncharacterized protein A4U43_C03F19360 [Asparagus officinalis]